jgi:8-oxo-dGTP pyrophosphatase MutT (NUDIX family)
MNRGAGLLVFERQGGRMLFLLRQDGSWGIPGGHAETGESAVETAVREFIEETGYQGKLWIDDVPVAAVCAGTRGYSVRGRCVGARFIYVVFPAEVPAPFRPALDHEHVHYGWERPTSAPEPLHPGLRLTLAEL